MEYEKPVVLDDDNPEWTAADFAQARPIGEFPEHLRSAFPNTQFPPAAPVTDEGTVALDADVFAKFRATGPGWQSRINAVLRRAQL